MTYVHTKDKLQCDQCASLFGSMDSLAKHKSRKHAIKKCDECEFTTYKNNELINHVLRDHPLNDYTREKCFQ